jgi:hypothetical protein
MRLAKLELQKQSSKPAAPIAGTSAHRTERRIALLIGNKDYKPRVGALVNPLNDVRLVGNALRTVGFEVLAPVQNASRADMLTAIYGLAHKLKSAGSEAVVGFLYYSGHGIASAGENYLMPVDIDEPSTIQLSVHGLKQSEVLGSCATARRMPRTIWCLMRVATRCRGRAAARVSCRSGSRMVSSSRLRRSRAKLHRTPAG